MERWARGHRGGSRSCEISGGEQEIETLLVFVRDTTDGQK